MTLCDCGELTWPGGALAIWADGVLHLPDAWCYLTDDLEGVML